MKPVLPMATHGQMWDFLTFFALTTVMGLSIFISLPLILYRGTPPSLIVLLNAFAIVS